MTEYRDNGHNDPMITGFTFAIILLAALLLFAVALFLFRRNSSAKEDKAQLTGKGVAVKALNRRLAQNPKDSGALTALANAYFDEGDWENAFKAYHRLQELPNAEEESSEFTTTLNFALSAIKLKNYKIAHRNFLIARGMKASDPQVNYNLGYLEYMNNNYEKAAGYLSQAYTADPHNVSTMKYLGLSFVETMRFNEAARILSQVVDSDPLDKQALFALGEAYQKLNRGEAAMKIFTHLRADPLLGPQASLAAGEKNLTTHQVKQAILDFEIGLRHKKIDPKTQKALMYNLGLACIENKEIARGLNHLKELQILSPNYQETEALIRKYSELHTNQNLQIYLLGEAAAFIALCQRLCVAIFPKARVKILSASSPQSDYSDILAEVFSSKWENVILFRFMRSTGDVGELVLRDLNAKIKEVHATRGLCISAGGFSSGAWRFVEARLIDLMAKEKLHQKLQSLGGK